MGKEGLDYITGVLSCVYIGCNVFMELRQEFACRHSMQGKPKED